MKSQHKALRIATALVFTGLLSGQVFAVPTQSNDATADVTVRLIQPISIQKNSDLNFGTLLTGGTATISLYPAGNMIPGDRVMPSVGNSSQPAVFVVSGEPALQYSLSGGDSSVQLENSNGDTITVQLFTEIGSTMSSEIGVLDNSGFDSVNVGGQFELNNTSRGTYSAPAGISLTVNYD